MPKQFSIRAMLLGVAIVAVAAFVLREWVILKHARYRLQNVRAGFNAVLVTFEDYVAASEELRAAEMDVPWIAQNAARSRHVEVLRQLLSYLESGACEWHPDAIESRSDFLRREIRRYDPSADLARHH